MTINERIKKIRTDKGYSQQKFADKINLSKNFGGDGNQYGIQMSAVDITNSRFNQFRVYQLGIAYQHYDIASKTATDVFTVDTAGQLDAAKIRVAKKATMQYNSTEDCIEFIFA